MKKIFLLFMFLMVTMFFFAVETIELLTPVYEPYSSETGPSLGCDIINAAFKAEGVNVKWLFYPQERCKALVKSGEKLAFASSVLAISKDEMNDFLLNDSPYLYLSVVAFYKKAKFPKGLGLKSPADLKDQIVGVIRGTGSVAVLTKAGAKLDYANEKESLMKKLIGDRHDISVIADLTGFRALEDIVGRKLKDYGYEPLYSSPLDLVFSSKFPDANKMSEIFLSGMKKIKANGTYMKIISKYYPKGNINKDALPKDLR